MSKWHSDQHEGTPNVPVEDNWNIIQENNCKLLKHNMCLNS